MCGEHPQPRTFRYDLTGSSPHVRGALIAVCRVAVRDGIIPACAGSTLTVSVSSPVAWDHPRMCGEHLLLVDAQSSRPGSSPHVRGALWSIFGADWSRGIIPACAGSTRLYRTTYQPMRDHPRMCGEHQVRDTLYGTTQGSSPHVRGARGGSAAGGSGRGIIPACAGSTLRK